MRIGTIAIAALLAMGVLALDGAADRLGAEGLTGEAAASCIEDGVTGRCHSLCPPVQPDGWACPM